MRSGLPLDSVRHDVLTRIFLVFDMVLGRGTDCGDHTGVITNLGQVPRAVLFISRVVHAVNYISRPQYSQSHQRRRVRLSKSGAVLVGFLIFHSLPNALLFSMRGRLKYSQYGQYHSTSLGTKVVEVFLLSAGLTHAVLGTIKAFQRLIEGSHSLHPNSRTKEMILTGSLIFVLLSMHIFDFRFNPNKDDRHLDAQVLEMLDRRYHRLRNALYWLLVISVFIHAWRGATQPWLFRLGFAKSEIPMLHKLCRLLLLGSLTLYAIPLLMENPYSQDPDSPIRGPRIITVD